MAKKGGFEKSAKDVEPKGLKEGSKAEEAYDKKQVVKKANGGGINQHKRLAMGMGLKKGGRCG